MLTVLNSQKSSRLRDTMIFLIGGFDEFAQLIDRAAAVAVLAELDMHRKPVLAHRVSAVNASGSTANPGPAWSPRKS